MNRGRFGELEVLAHAPQGAAHAQSVLFVHGAYTAAWCWDEHFLPWFAQAGFAAYALSLSGHGNSPERVLLDRYGIDDYVADVEAVVAALPAPPVLVGHSMGGLVVQKVLERQTLPGAVLLASVPPQGLWSSAMGLMLRKPEVMQDLNRLMGGSEIDVDSVREALFWQDIPFDELIRFCRHAQPESLRAIWDMTWFNLPRPARVAPVPMLVLGAERDHLFPPELVEETGRAYGAPVEIFPGMGHAMMLERDWRKVAERIATWLRREFG